MFFEDAQDNAIDQTQRDETEQAEDNSDDDISNKNIPLDGRSSAITDGNNYIYMAAITKSTFEAQNNDTLPSLMGGTREVGGKTFTKNNTSIEIGAFLWDNNHKKVYKTIANASLQIEDNAHTYSYVGWGEWSGGDASIQQSGSQGHNIEHGHYIIGIPSNHFPTPEYPSGTAGQATYTGTIQGDYTKHGTDTRIPNAIGGSITINTDFDNNKLLDITINASCSAGSCTNDTNGNWATARGSNIQFNRSENNFTGNLTVDDGGQGQVSGSFYGNQAQETAGGLYIDKQSGDGGGASAIFRAKR